jgi:hypothetical protein
VSRQDAGMAASDAANAPAAQSTIAPRERTPGRMLARAVLALVLLINGAWITGFWVLNRDAEMPRVQADLVRHVARIEHLLGASDLTTSASLGALQDEFQATTADLQQLNSLLPLGGAWPFGTVSTEHHLLELAMDTTQTAQNIIWAVPILQPQVTTIEQSLIHADEGPGATAYGPPLTIHTINQGQFYLDTARQYWQLGTQERQRLTIPSVAALHNADASTFLHQYDELAPRLATGLELASSLLDWSPGALGVGAPDHFLLLVVDPSDLRPGGGRIWDYADLVTQGGALVSGIHLHSARSLDCPHSLCGTRPIPQAYAWFPLNRDQFGLTDADLDPDLPSAAATIKTTYQLETGERVDGIIILTPAVYASLLHITGPLTLPGMSVKVTASNVEALLIAEHEVVPAVGATQRRTTLSDLEMLLTQAILARLAAAGAGGLGQLAAALFAATQSKDLSFYGNSPRVETMLRQLGMARSIETLASDSFLIVDTNDGSAAVNPQVIEHVSDEITLDARGTAQHNLAITYTYSYDAAAALSGTHPLQPYQDFLRVIVPGNASPPHITGACVPEQAVEDAHVTAACQLTLMSGATTVIRMTWSVPAVFTHNGSQYSLLVQLQAGAQMTVSVRIVLPTGESISHPTVSSGPTPHQNGSALMWVASPLTRDTLLSTSLLATGLPSAG